MRSLENLQLRVFELFLQFLFVFFGDKKLGFGLFDSFLQQFDFDFKIGCQILIVIVRPDHALLVDAL